MTYVTGSNIEATDYNAFATLSSGINEIYADNNSGATNLPEAAFGYGQIPLIPVSSGANIQASEWAALFQTMRDCGTHQGTSVIPPVPATGPVPGDTIVAENTGSTMESTVELLQINKTNLAAGQTTLIVGSTETSASSWFTLLTYSFQVDFGSWDNARYFFNSGGSLQINGAYPTGSTPAELVWKNSLASKSPFVFNWNSTKPASGSNAAALHPIGFWKESTTDPLTTSYQIVFSRVVGVGYYTGSYIQIEAKLASSAGTDGLIDFLVSLIDGDVTPDIKTAGIEFTVNNSTSTGAVTYPGPAVVITPVGFTYT